MFLSVHVPGAAAAMLLGEQAAAFNDLLVQVGSDRDLVDEHPEEITERWPAWRLHRQLRDLPGVDWVIAGKLLARKRPRLVPVYDRVVREVVGRLSSYWLALHQALRLGILAIVLLGIIDANYLNQERAFRRLYDAVARGDNVQRFSMNPSLAAPATHAALEAPINRTSSRWRRTLASIRDWFPDQTVWLSWAIAPFYGGLFVVGILIASRVALH